ncbi:MAG: TIGR03560 family F420-dependent LLM class oxidoreductase [Chloroflexi bacterium]|nr:TIGR03560 family F420-dependent LLM class oxidoreductase [Chloroflexota bacterium]
MPFNLGIHTGQQDCSLEDLRRVWRLADASGFYWVSIWDHFYENPTVDGKGPCFEGVSIMTALAAETRRVRVGSLVFCMGYRHPALLAKAAVTVDHVSNGRLELGVGAGWYELEHQAFGIPFPPVKERMDRLEEGVQIVKSMLANETTTFVGKHFQVENANCFPRPVQKPPRVWVGGGGEQRTLRIAARYADGWNAPYISPELYKHKIEVLDGWCGKEGRDPAALTRTVNVGFWMGATRAEAQVERDRYAAQYGAQAEARSGGQLFGTPKEAVERIGQYIDAGAQGLNIALRAPFNWDALQAFSEEVLPAFK